MISLPPEALLWAVTNTCLWKIQKVKQQEPNVVRTHEDYLKEKEIKDYNKKMWHKVQAEKLKLQDEKDWDEIDKEKENTNEEINDGTSDSSNHHD